MEINLHQLEIFLSSGRGCPPPSQVERQRDHAPSAVSLKKSRSAIAPKSVTKM
jgi:hypothetical protein